MLHLIIHQIFVYEVIGLSPLNGFETQEQHLWTLNTDFEPNLDRVCRTSFLTFPLLTSNRKLASASLEVVEQELKPL